MPPKIVKRRSTAGSVIQTYEFPLQMQPKKTLGQLLYDSKKGKILGRTPKNWGKEFSIIFYFRQDKR